MCMLRLILIEAVHRVGHEAAEGHKEGGGKGLVHGVGEVAEIDALPNSRPTLKQPLIKPARRAMARPWGS